MRQDAERKPTGMYSRRVMGTRDTRKTRLRSTKASHHKESISR
ncbi:hypothetical protein BN2364_1889 [Alloalcanivorax xenomutans]|nr:hypothetical protein BN2364_1889 [Alloalcanivorax xenomutans]